MEKEQKKAFNTDIIVYAVLLLILIAMALFFWMDSENNKVLSIVCFAFCAVPIFAFVISPTVFVFDREGITIVYLLGMEERILWGQIRSVSERGSWWHRGRGGGMPAFEISYPRRGKYPFFMDLCVTRNRRTKRLFKEYYKGDIEKY